MPKSKNNIISSLDKYWDSSKHFHISPLVILIIILITTFLAWNITLNSVEQHAKERFEFQISDAENSILERFSHYEQVLRSGLAFFNSSDNVTRKEWKQFVDTLEIEKFFPGTLGVGYSQWLTPSQLSSHIEKIRQQGFPNFTVRPVGKREQYSSIIFLEPFNKQNRRAFGYDMYSESIRRQAMIKARDSGKSAISEKVTLVQEADTGSIQAGFLIYMPHYHYEVNQLKDRQKALAGYVYSALRVGDLMQGILGQRLPELDFTIYDGENTDSENKLYSSGEAKAQPKYQMQKILDIGDHTWTIRYRSNPTFDKLTSSHLPSLVAVSGVAIGFLLFTVLLSFVRLRNDAEDLLISSEDKLNEAQRVTHFGSWDLDIKNDALYWSEETYRIFGCDPKKFIPSYANFLSLIHPDDRLMIDQAYQLSVKNNEVYNVEHRICLRNGKVKYVRGYAEAQYNDKNIAIRISGTIQDITELKEKEDQLRHTIKMDALGKLTGGIAHDYNNMMGIILGYTDLLLSHVVDNKKATNYVVQIRTAGERARDLTLKLMALSQNKPSMKTVVSINKELKNQESLLEKMLTSRIKLNIDLGDGLWPTHIDAGDFNDAIVNMAINTSHAIKTSGTVNLSTYNVTLNKKEAEQVELTAGEYVRVLFADSGEGMSSQTASKIFDPFFSTKGEEGTGLGMSQVYGFVTRSNGAIKVSSELNIGTELVLYFPRCYDSIAEQNAIKDTSNKTLSSTEETILVVDDEEILCNMAKEILTNQGYLVLLAHSGAQALEILETERVDIVFSDVIMPGMTGHELAIKISDKYPDILIQLSSGYIGDKKLDSLNNSFLFDVLQKPYSSEELLNKIAALSNKNNQPLEVYTSV